MKFQFNLQIAKDVGVEEAIIYSNIEFWCQKNVANKKHFYEGYFWTYNSMEAFMKIFPFWTHRQIERILKNLEEKNYIKSGNHNKIKYDRTKWYCCTKSDFDFTKWRNGFSETVKPIPDNINTDNKHKEKKNTNGEMEDSQLSEERKQIPPTLEMVDEYCKERKNEINPQRFLDFYETRGWLCGKTKMKNWQAAVRTWEKQSSNTATELPDEEQWAYEHILKYPDDRDTAIYHYGTKLDKAFLYKYDTSGRYSGNKEENKEMVQNLKDKYYEIILEMSSSEARHKLGRKSF